MSVNYHKLTYFFNGEFLELLEATQVLMKD